MTSRVLMIVAISTESGFRFDAGAGGHGCTDTPPRAGSRSAERHRGAGLQPERGTRAHSNAGGAGEIEHDPDGKDSWVLDAVRGGDIAIILPGDVGQGLAL